jgi:hypothetical protein
MPNSIWIISPGLYSDYDVSALGIKAEPKKVMAYGLSDIGRYLIHPGPIEVENQLMGCECDLQPVGIGRARQLGKRLLAWRRKSGMPTGTAKHAFLVRNAFKIPTLRDRQLAKHVEHLRDLLHSLGPAFQEIASIDLSKIAELCR